MTTDKLILDYVYEHEEQRADKVFLTQPLGGDEVIDYTWSEVVGQARRMAAHLKAQGYEPGDRIAILSKNCAHFFIAELAIWMGGFTTVAIFPTEGPETVHYVLEHSDAKLLFVGKLDAWESQAPGVPDDVDKIAFPLAPETEFDQWDEVIERTEPIEGRPSRDPKDLAMIIYTSGSTGRPKGAMHSFGGISKVAVGIVDTLGIDEHERSLSYLPLAHVFERAYVECCAFVAASHVFFADTLDTFVQDLRRARPTLFISVPRLWLKFQQGVLAKMPPAKLDLFLKIPILSGIVRKKVLTNLGLEHVRLAGSGSAPIPAELIAWYRRLGLNLMEGYAMTEDFAYSHLSTIEKNAPGYVGMPYPGVDVKFSEEGEILISSPGLMVGYYKQPELDAEVFTEDGYFRTGDKGERSDNGLLKLTGRVKELFKTAKGKYVAPAPIENMINEHPIVELSCVSGSGQSSAYALVVIAEEIRPQLSDPAIRERIEKELAALLEKVNSRVASYERLRMIVISDEPWTIENGLLTPTMKLKRAKLEEKTESHLDEWYGTKGPVIWG